jgi:phosphoglycolate phosphatase-like HAD superfamily hydrolase
MLPASIEIILFDMAGTTVDDAAMGKFSVKDPQNVVKVGDTEVDILEGKNAGAWTVGVLSGTQPRRRLAALQPDFLVENIRSIADLIRQRRTIFTRPGY